MERFVDTLQWPSHLVVKFPDSFWRSAARVRFHSGLPIVLSSPYMFVRLETMDRIRDPRGVLLSARKALKMEWVGFHDFRHFRATQWVKQGIDLRTVQELLGHRDITAEGEPFLLAGGESGSVTA